MSRGLALGRGSIGIPPLVDSYFANRAWVGTGQSGLLVPTPFSVTSDALVWFTSRTPARNRLIINTARGSNRSVKTNGNAGEAVSSPSILTFGASGLTLSSNSEVNDSGDNYIGWIFKKRADFFDHKQFPANGGVNTITHDLGSVPGAVMVHVVESGYLGSWLIWHRGLSATGAYISLSHDNPETAPDNNLFGDNVSALNPTSASVKLGNSLLAGSDFIVLFFGHDVSEDGLIQCGSFTGNGNVNGPIITLGWEPQWLLIKNTDEPNTDWRVLDAARGMSGTLDPSIAPNTFAVEDVSFDRVLPTSTGFQLKTSNVEFNGNGDRMIYIAVRRH